MVIGKLRNNTTFREEQAVAEWPSGQARLISGGMLAAVSQAVLTFRDMLRIAKHKPS